jgi:membrane protease subunit HflC
MFDKLIEVIIQFLDDILPFTVVPHYDRGVRLRFGKKASGALTPGFYWKIPFVDQVLKAMVKTTTLELGPQAVTTRDNNHVVVKGVVKYEIDDVVTLLLEVNDPVDAVNDMARGIIRDSITSLDFSQINTRDLVDKIKGRIVTEARKWGIKVTQVTITDLGLIQSVHLITTQPFTPVPV